MSQLHSQVLLTIVLLLPGAIAGSAFQRYAPRYNNRLSDWFLRMLGISTLFLALGAWPLYWLYSNYWDALTEREPLPWLLLLVPFFYLTLPAVAGVILGKAVASGKPWATRLIGENRAPLAWDYLFGASVRGFIRCRLKSGRWVGGYYNSEKSPYGPKSYASDDPSNLDLYIGCGLEFCQESGNPILQKGKYRPTDSGILLKWEDIETLEFQQLKNVGTDNERQS